VEESNVTVKESTLILRRRGRRRGPLSRRTATAGRAHAAQQVGGTPTSAAGENVYMSVRPAGSGWVRVDERPTVIRRGPLDPNVDFERYREAACKRFVAMARALGHHAFHDLDELAKDFYDDFWADWLSRPSRELTGAPVPYIAGAMMNKLRDLSRRGHSVRAPELVRSDSDAILATIAAEDLEPSDQVVLQEEMWLVSEIVHSLPEREQLVFAAVFGRDSKKKGSPVAGYKLAASKLGVSEARAKKLSLSANRRIRAAVERIESGSWCERWARSIELVAAGKEGEAEFLQHAAHCAHCRLGIVHLRRQAAILPLPANVAAEHLELLSRIWAHARGSGRAVRDQAVGLVGRHANSASDASGIVSTGGAAGAGVTAFKVGVVCLGVGLTGGAASVCLQVAGVPTPLTGLASSPAPHRRPRPRQRATRIARTAARPTVMFSSATTPSAQPRVAAPPRTPSRPAHSTSTATTTAAQQSAAAAQNEFNPGGGSGSQIPAGSSGSTPVMADRAARSAAVAPPAASTGSGSSASGEGSGTTKSSSGAGGGTVTSGSSNSLTAP
jgi:DNA-directed RNA polymerase specialized sigma24 family protein